jgi:predicted regulator of Ras-like GTPase activity (Roadblock/LC7/MglB family)
MKIELGPLRDLAGFVGAAVFDSESGLVLGKLGGDAHAIEAAASASADVVRAARRMAQSLETDDDLEDLLICYWDAYHLVRALERTPAIMLYLSLDRRSANLGVARLALRAVEAAATL